ncbi:MAG: hypothetical protein SF066_18280 [Thermoanaerobaculia bacterium]|nr:hypothetical protein [Thermoanaerobaculia bacterium]
MKTLAVAACCVLGLLAVGPAWAEMPQPVVTPPAVAVDSVVSEVVGSCDLVPAEAPLFEASCGLCPVWAPSCTKDSQCDAFCGGVGYGACLPFQACTRCCGCNT